MNPLPPVELSENDDFESQSSGLDIPVLQDPVAVVPGKAPSTKKKRNAVILGLALAAVCATWLAANMPMELENVLPDNWQADFKSMTGQDPVARNDS